MVDSNFTWGWGITIQILCLLTFLDDPAVAIDHKVDRNSHDLFLASTSRGLMDSGDAITLNDRILIEDDAPGFGFSVEGKVEEILEEGVLLRKTLIVDTWPIQAAHLVMLVYPVEPPDPNNGRHLLFTVNDHPCEPYEVNHFWTNAPVPTEFLRSGENTIEVRVHEPDTKFKTFVAMDAKFALGSTTRTSHPNRSARSGDRGKTWMGERLGAQGTVDGEYPIRMAVTAYEREGWLESPVLDLASNTEWGIVRPAVEMKSAKLDFDRKAPKGTATRLSVRNGSTHFVDEENWSEWKECDPGDLAAELHRDRFLQFRLVLETDDPSVSPALFGASLETEYTLKDEAALKGITVLSTENRPRKLSSFDFQHEDCLNEKLQTLRRDRPWEEVVAGAKTEFESILKLKTWVSGQWEWFLPGKDYPDFSAWDASKILCPQADGKPLGGFCLHYAIALMQACQSFGIPARVINANASVWGGHELVEVWSNDYAKWVLMDAQFDTCFFDRKTDVPLSALELHRIFLDRYYPNETLDRDHWPRAEFVKRIEAVESESPIRCLVGGGAKSGTLKSYAWDKPAVELTPYCGGYGFLNMAFIRFLPRSNFLSQPLPMPLNHGRGCHWGWDGYLCWYDERSPRGQEFKIFTNRENDLYPNLNCVDFSAEVAGPGRFKVWMDTLSPNYSHYEVTSNGEKQEIQTPGYDWALKEGRNELRMRVVDQMGNRGPESRLDLNYLP